MIIIIIIIHASTFLTACAGQGHGGGFCHRGKSGTGSELNTLPVPHKADTETDNHAHSCADLLWFRVTSYTTAILITQWTKGQGEHANCWPLHHHASLLLLIYFYKCNNNKLGLKLHVLCFWKFTSLFWRILFSYGRCDEAACISVAPISCCTSAAKTPSLQRLRLCTNDAGIMPPQS